jgi:hypothetical protein
MHLRLYTLVPLLSVLPAVALASESDICTLEPPATLELQYRSMVLPQSKPSEREKYRAPRTTLDVETYPAAPPALALEQVHVYVRHGPSHVFFSLSAASDHA